MSHIVVISFTFETKSFDIITGAFDYDICQYICLYILGNLHGTQNADDFIKSNMQQETGNSIVIRYYNTYLSNIPTDTAHLYVN